MARSFVTANLLSAIADGVSLAITRRCYSTTSRGLVSSVGRGGRSGVAKTGEEKVKKAIKEAETSWVPDPVTGYYRPANRAGEVDAVELREMLLKQKLHQH
ncbi:late embryogenesis abundant protein Lea5-like [Magnolia sinica]|uniref:late embryogenesis abundant protein Lea5-like n=1 Tax=Magnolia sinica TaxID=86752 RepID=UPI00265A20B1|nr:late embryogenesis abundant protein Lea5-like [Magnolia sinica]